MTKEEIAAARERIVDIHLQIAQLDFKEKAQREEADRIINIRWELRKELDNLTLQLMRASENKT